MIENKDIASESGVIEAELAKHGVYASITRGPSMRPLFKTGRDMVIIARVEKPLKKYDVVLYTGAHNKYTMHRIIGIRDDAYIIRGDNTYKKEYVKKENIIGILTEFNRRGKRVSTEKISYKIYSRFWHYIYPVRHILYKLKSLLSKIKHKILGKAK